MNTYSVKILSETVEGTLNGSPRNTFSRLLTDSRNLAFPAENLFIALKGEKTNGHQFIPELYNKGVRCFLVSEKIINYFSDASYIIVNDTLEALQRFAAFHRSKFSIPVVGITGSNGKTIVKEWLYEILKEQKTIVRSPGSFNSQLGVPLSVFLADSSHNLGIFEAGISRPGEMEKLAEIINPEIGIFTNIGPAHQSNFTDYQQKAFEKLKLFEKAKILIYPEDFKVLQEMIPGFSRKSGVKLFSWSLKNTSAQFYIKSVEKLTASSIITGIYNDEIQIVTIPFTDTASVENCITCWSALIVMGYPFDFIKENLAKLAHVEMRLQLNEGINNSSIINDTYSSDTSSLRVSLEFLEQQKQYQRKIIILSDIQQNSVDEDALYSEVSQLINPRNPALFIGIGPSLSKHRDKFDVQSVFYKDTGTFISDMHSHNLSGSVILIKGARQFRFEEIGEKLQQRAHETVMEINLNSLSRNLKVYKSLLPEGMAVMAMVKAFSYGSGMFEIAGQLQYDGVEYLGVAYADEGIELRKAGITLPIMVMSPEPGSFSKMLDFNLEPEIYNLRTLLLFQHEVVKQGIPQAGVHIKLDTGMRRLGFGEAELSMLLFRLKDNKWLKIKSAFSHLASADNPADDDFTRRQIEKFNFMASEIEKTVGYSFIKHIQNSAGIERFRNLYMGMARLGIGLYGFAICDELKSKLENVITLKSVISQIKYVSTGETVGYNKNGVMERDSVIATVPVGYADGLNRRLGNGRGAFKVNGSIAPVVGNVCMDMCMIDITGIDAKEGDEVVIFDSVDSILRIAETLQTIPYEVLTNISRRVKRIYYRD